MAKPGKDEILKDLIEFFLDGLAEDPLGVQDWLVQGDWDATEFVEGVKYLKHAMTLRD